jgi:hypothetical protein
MWQRLNHPHHRTSIMAGIQHPPSWGYSPGVIPPLCRHTQQTGCIPHDGNLAIIGVQLIPKMWAQHGHGDLTKGARLCFRPAQPSVTKATFRVGTAIPPMWRASARKFVNSHSLQEKKQILKVGICDCSEVHSSLLETPGPWKLPEASGSVHGPRISRHVENPKTGFCFQQQNGCSGFAMFVFSKSPGRPRPH